MDHYIIAGGAYDLAFAKLAATGFQLNWQSAPPPVKRRESKVKYHCPQCDQNAWANPNASLICGLCYQSSGSCVAMA